MLGTAIAQVYIMFAPPHSESYISRTSSLPLFLISFRPTSHHTVAGSFQPFFACFAYVYITLSLSRHSLEVSHSLTLPSSLRSFTDNNAYYNITNRYAISERAQSIGMRDNKPALTIRANFKKPRISATKEKQEKAQNQEELDTAG